MRFSLDQRCLLCPLKRPSNLYNKLSNKYKQLLTCRKSPEIVAVSYTRQNVVSANLNRSELPKQWLELLQNRCRFAEVTGHLKIKMSPPFRPSDSGNSVGLSSDFCGRRRAPVQVPSNNGSGLDRFVGLLTCSEIQVTA